MSRLWTVTELAVMRRMSHLGAAAIALKLHRSVHSVRCAANRNHVSLRREGQLSGLVLGQPRGVSMRQLLGGHYDPATSALVAERAKAYADAHHPVCPSCGSRPQRVTSTGLCGVCHKRNLTMAHEELMAERAAQRELWTARQRKKRMSDGDDAV